MVKLQQAFGEDTMGPTSIKERYHWFKDSRLSAESNSRSGWPSDAIIAQVQSLLEEDSRSTVRELAEMMDTTGATHSSLREDLALRRVAAKFVQRLLTNEQKQLSGSIAGYAWFCSQYLRIHERNHHWWRPVFTGMTLRRRWNHQNEVFRHPHSYPATYEIWVVLLFTKLKYLSGDLYTIMTVFGKSSCNLFQKLLLN